MSEEEREEENDDDPRDSGRKVTENPFTNFLFYIRWTLLQLSIFFLDLPFLCT